MFRTAEINHRFVIVRIKRHIGAALRGAGIAGGDEEFFQTRAFGQCPGQSMFASPRSDKQHIHGSGPFLVPSAFAALFPA